MHPISHISNEVVIIAGYLVLMITIGLVFKHFNKDVSDYFRNGCKGTWWLVGSSIFMGAFSAWTFTGAAGLAYNAGWTMMVIYAANSVFLFLNFLIFAAWFRQLRATTTPEVLRMRFGESTRQFYAWVNVLTYSLYGALYLYGLAIFTASVFRLDIFTTIVAIGTVVLIYTTLSGSWGVMAADFLQALIMFPMTLLIAYLSLKALGGVHGLFQQVHAQGLDADYALLKPSTAVKAVTGYTAWWILAMFIKNGSINVSINSAVRFFAVKDGWEARKAALLACVLMTVGALVWIIPPVAARLLFSDTVAATPISEPAEASYAVASMMLLPNGLMGLMVVVIFTATVSSMDIGLNRNTAMVVRDIYPAFCRWFGWKEFGTRGMLVLSRVVNMAFGGAMILGACYFASIKGQGVFKFMLDIGALLGLPMSLPLVLGMFVKRAPWWSAMASVLAGFLTGAYGYLSGVNWDFQTTVFANTLAGCGTFFITMPFWKSATPAYREQVKDFFTKMHKPVDFTREVGASADLSQLKIVGTFALTIGLAINLIMLVDNPWIARLYILAVASFVAGVGLLMLLYAARQSRRQAPVAAESAATIQPIPAEETASNE